MGIKMNTYTGNQMTAEYDGIIQHRAITESGILHGCEISYMGANQVHIEKGYMMIMGRFCTVTEETIKVAMSSSSTEIPGRLYIHADLSDAQTPVKFMSVAASSLPSLEQDEDFNYTNGIYEIELATYTAGMTTIKDLQSTCPEISSGGGAGTIGENFSEQVSYSAGDYVIRKNTLYKFTSDHSAGAWNENHVTATTVTAELEEQNKNFENLTNKDNPILLLDTTEVTTTFKNFDLAQSYKNFKKLYFEVEMNYSTKSNINFFCAEMYVATLQPNRTYYIYRQTAAESKEYDGSCCFEILENDPTKLSIKKKAVGYDGCRRINIFGIK